jgi:hypothetical protein
MIVWDKTRVFVEKQKIKHNKNCASGTEGVVVVLFWV